MYRLRYLLLLLAIFSVSLIGATSPLALTQQQEPPSGLTGAHSVLTCDSCHAEEVWHTTGTNITICKLCHINVWDTVSGGLHSEILYEGDMDVATGNVVVRYCSTCHNPHQPNILRLTYTDGTTEYTPFAEYTELCIKCHDL